MDGGAIKEHMLWLIHFCVHTYYAWWSGHTSKAIILETIGAIIPLLAFQIVGHIYSIIQDRTSMMEYSIRYDHLNCKVPFEVYSKNMSIFCILV